MKCRLGEAALTQVKFAFARQKTVSEETARSLEPPALVKVLLVGDEHIPNEVGMADQVDILRPDAPVRDVAVISLHGDHHRERVAHDFEHELPGISSERAWRSTAITPWS